MGSVPRIGVVAPSSRFSNATAARMEAHVEARFPGGDVKVVFHPACFANHGHFAGDDALRARAFLEMANDPRYDALWFARGGYGSCRIAEAVRDGLKPEARTKRYLGYSDAGSLLATLYKTSVTARGPRPSTARSTG